MLLHIESGPGLSKAMGIWDAASQGSDGREESSGADTVGGAL